MVSFFRNGLRTAVAAEIPQCVAPCEKLRPRSSLRHIETICRRTVIFPFCPSHPKITLCLSGHSGRHIPHHLEHLIEILVGEDDCSSGKTGRYPEYVEVRDSSRFLYGSLCLFQQQVFQETNLERLRPRHFDMSFVPVQLSPPSGKGHQFLLQTEAAAYRLQFGHPPSSTASNFLKLY